MYEPSILEIPINLKNEISFLLNLHQSHEHEEKFNNFLKFVHIRLYIIECRIFCISSFTIYFKISSGNGTNLLILVIGYCCWLFFSSSSI